MKCPKCGYLGFETTDRCRHCGYDFSLSVTTDKSASQALPLRNNAEREAPFDDFDLHNLHTDTNTTATAVATPSSDELEAAYGISEFLTPATPPAPSAPSAPSVSAPARVDPGRATTDKPSRDDLPLFTATPPPARPPLAVRRATPEVQRRRTPSTIKRDVADVGLELEAAPGERTAYAGERVSRNVSAIRRMSAALVDLLILGSICATVIYFTLAIAGLSMNDWRVIPVVPMTVFLLLLVGGYLVGFTAGSGQTIGKMMAGIQVVASDGGGVPVGAAVLRALGALVSVALVGLPYLPVLVSSDRRALHDRIASTRVTPVAPFDYRSGRPER
jgi:uncharacterized RDD family membrane protein YckC